MNRCKLFRVSAVKRITYDGTLNECWNKTFMNSVLELGWLHGYELVPLIGAGFFIFQEGVISWKRLMRVNVRCNAKIG